jgi:hypothetical protein
VLAPLDSWKWSRTTKQMSDLLESSSILHNSNLPTLRYQWSLTRVELESRMARVTQLRGRFYDHAEPTAGTERCCAGLRAFASSGPKWRSVAHPTTRLEGSIGRPQFDAVIRLRQVDSGLSTRITSKGSRKRFIVPLGSVSQAEMVTLQRTLRTAPQDCGTIVHPHHFLNCKLR